MTEASSGSGDQILRVERNRNYKTLNLHAIADDASLSWKAVGILSYLLSRPDGWKFNRRDIVGRHTDGRTSVKSGLSELEDAGYLSRNEIRSDGGHYQYRWTVREHPEDDGGTKSAPAAAQNPGTENPSTDNPPHSSKECSNEEGVHELPSGNGEGRSPAELSLGIPPGNGDGPTDGERQRVDEAVQYVFEYCRERRIDRLGDLPGPSIRLTDRRRTKIRARLREALQEIGSLRRAVAFLCLAADGFYADDWAERDDYLDMTKYLYDDAGTTEKWARKALENREGVGSEFARRVRRDAEEMRQTFGEGR